MNRVIIAIALLLPASALPCSWVDRPPLPADLVADFDDAFETRDVIFRGYVREIDGVNVTIDVAEAFKGADVVGDSFTHPPSSSCDIGFSEENAEYLFFGILYHGQLVFRIADGAVRSDNPFFEPLLEKLRDRRTD